MRVAAWVLKYAVAASAIHVVGMLLVICSDPLHAPEIHDTFLWQALAVFGFLDGLVAGSLLAFLSRRAGRSVGLSASIGFLSGAGGTLLVWGAITAVVNGGTLEGFADDLEFLVPSCAINAATGMLGAGLLLWTRRRANAGNGSRRMIRRGYSLRSSAVKSSPLGQGPAKI